VTHPAPPAVESGGDVTWKRVATGVKLLARISSQLSGFARICHTLAVVSVFGLGATWIIALLTGRQPPFRPVLLTMLILVALLAADGMAALLLGRPRAAPRPAGEKRRGISMCPRPTRRTRRSPPLKSRSTKRSAMLSASKWLGRPSLSPTASKRPSAGRWRSRRYCCSPRLGPSIFIHFCRNGRRPSWTVSPRLPSPC
jgi:hypothetical protein